MSDDRIRDVARKIVGTTSAAARPGEETQEEAIPQRNRPRWQDDPRTYLLFFGGVLLGMLSAGIIAMAKQGWFDFTFVLVMSLGFGLVFSLILFMGAKIGD